MNITIINDSPTHAVTLRKRVPGQPRTDDTLPPRGRVSFVNLPPDTSISCLPGPEAEPAQSPAPTAPIPNPASGASAPTRAELEALTWPDLRKRAIAAGAPKTVSKADAIALLLNQPA
ncbi:MAG: hypothetical protein NBV67_02440 [Tagaea sp.]|nr:hypothetical protein [Tagaea sp.]